MEPVSTIALAALILASRSGAEELGKDAGQSAWSGLSRLRVLVTRKFQGDKQATQALLVAEQRPQDDQAVLLLRQALEEHTARDARFAGELQRLIDEARQRTEYQPGSKLFDNYGWVGKITVFNAPIRLDQGDFNIN
ncbi:MAG: hypothetical protein ACLPKI_20445 [Streptosporangiaceae bacterium]